MVEQSAEAQRSGWLLALWNDVEAGFDADYNDWHAHEHVPERCTVPGIQWAMRCSQTGGETGPRYLTLYGLRDVEVLQSAPYLRLLSHPTPASALMRPRLRRVSRWVCRMHAGNAAPGADADVLMLWTGASSRTAADSVCAQLRAQAGAASPWLAERWRDASPLPWLPVAPPGQAEPVSGGWLVGQSGRPCGLAASAAGGWRQYRRLPGP